MHDVKASYNFLPFVPKNSIVIGDKGYVSDDLNNFLSKFGKVIKATSIGGFLTKLKLFILTYSFDCFLKLDKDKQNLLFN